jgi:putative phage-type endonuclease
MTEKEQWLKERRTGIGSSDAAVILGANPWKSPFALWTEKTGLVEPDSLEGNEPVLWGNILEPVIADQYALRTGRQLRDYGRYHIQRNPCSPFAHATIDREIAPVDERGPGILEIKTVSLRFSHLWEEEAPLYYQIQLQHQFMVTGLRWGTFAPLIGGQQLLEWREEVPNPKFISILAEKEEEFWSHVQRMEPPEVDGSLSTSKIIKELYHHETGMAVDLPEAAMEWDRELVDIKGRIKTLETRQSDLENRLKQEIKDAGRGILPNGVVYRFQSVCRPGHFVKPSEFRVLKRMAEKWDLASKELRESLPQQGFKITKSA